MASKLKDRWKTLLAEYGRFAIAIYVVLVIVSIIGFAIAISSGLDLGRFTGGKVGTVAAVWVSLKVTQPIRIGITLVLTPIVAGLFRRRAHDEPSTPDELSAPDELPASDESE